MRNFLIALLLLTIGLNDLHAQDARYTQYFQAPLYINPAFTGSTGLARIGMNYRKQGDNASSELRSFSFYLDYLFSDFSLSMGAMAHKDIDANSGFFTTVLALPISYDFAVNKKFVIKPALQGSYSIQGIDHNFLFADQIDPQGNITGGSSAEGMLADRVRYWDISTGILAYGKSWWLGYAMHNLLQNNISFFSTGEEILDVRYSVHGGASILLNKPRGRKKVRNTVMPTFGYVSQGGFSQLDAGVIFQLDMVLAGAIYRGIPTPLFDGDYSAVALVFGIQKFKFSMNYSYDMAINSPTSPGGSHELSLAYRFNPTPNATPRSSKRLRCPLPY